MSIHPIPYRSISSPSSLSMYDPSHPSCIAFPRLGFRSSVVRAVLRCTSGGILVIAIRSSHPIMHPCCHPVDGISPVALHPGGRSGVPFWYIYSSVCLLGGCITPIVFPPKFLPDLTTLRWLKSMTPNGQASTVMLKRPRWTVRVCSSLFWALGWLSQLVFFTYRVGGSEPNIPLSVYEWSRKSRLFAVW